MKRSKAYALQRARKIANVVTIDSLKSRVGEKTWEEARREAWRSAARTGTLQNFKAHPVAALQQVRDMLDNAGLHRYSDVKLMRLYTDVYRELPSFGLLFDMFITRRYDEMSPTARTMFWDFAKAMLSDSNASLADPVANLMWCDFFEVEPAVYTAWKNLVLSGDPPSLLLERVLDSSGPVPFGLKIALYRRLMSDTKWHYWIFRSLLHSCLDVYGQVDREAAQDIFLQLSLPADCEDLERLEKALS